MTPEERQEALNKGTTFNMAPNKNGVYRVFGYARDGKIQTKIWFAVLDDEDITRPLKDDDVMLLWRGNREAPIETTSEFAGNLTFDYDPAYFNTTKN